MTYANPEGEFDDSRDVMLGATWTPSASSALAYLGVKNTWLAERDARASVDAAEARGVNAQIIATWRGLISEYAAKDDVDSLVELQLLADGYTAQGNLGPVTQQVEEAAKKVVEDTEKKLEAAAKGAGSAVSTVLWAGLGLGILYVVLKARE